MFIVNARTTDSFRWFSNYRKIKLFFFTLSLERTCFFGLLSNLYVLVEALHAFVSVFYVSPQIHRLISSIFQSCLLSFARPQIQLRIFFIYFFAFSVGGGGGGGNKVRSGLKMSRNLRQICCTIFYVVFLRFNFFNFFHVFFLFNYCRL